MIRLAEEMRDQHREETGKSGVLKASIFPSQRRWLQLCLKAMLRVFSCGRPLHQEQVWVPSGPALSLPIPPIGSASLWASVYASMKLADSAYFARQCEAPNETQCWSLSIPQLGHRP